MDKVKIYLGYAAKYHFWILCVVVVLIGLFGWSKARGVLDEEFAANKGTVTGKFTALQGVQANSNHPNSEWATALSELTKQEQDEVDKTWKAVYATQQEVLAWPAVMPSGFVDFIQRNPPDAEIPPQWRSIYQTEVIKEEFPKLAKIVEAAPMSTEGRGRTATTPGMPLAAVPAPSTPAGDASATQYRVSWTNQDAVYNHLSLPGGSTPSSFQIRIRQEDYWVYQALLNIIRRTNDGSLYTPRIKVIRDLAIGANTAKLFEKGMGPGHITMINKPEGGESASAAVDGEAGEGEPMPDQGRYLAEDGTILPAGTSGEQQLKRLPIYLNLVMDQREITRLLTECANYPLPVEVRQLRINPGGSAVTPSAAAAPQAGRGGAAAPGTPTGESFDVSVELHGIIYIYNPPDPGKLGGGEAGIAAG